MLLSAGERRAYTANTVLRNSAWRRRDFDGGLRISAADAQNLHLNDGDWARLITASGEARIRVDISDRMSSGHVSLPNGYGLDNGIAANQVSRTGTATNELTASQHRDCFAATPWHKLIPARIERIVADDQTAPD